MDLVEFKNHLKKYLSDEEIDKLLNALSKERTYSFLLNRYKYSEEQLLEMFSSVKKHDFIKNLFTYDNNIDQLGKSFLFENGAYYIIDSSSSLIANFIQFKDGENVLDMCAAPGGKTISIALQNKNTNIIANDLSFSRAKILRQNIERLGLANVTVTSSDLTKIYSHYLNTFDKIILDAPCSGSGMFRKHELMQLDWTYNKVLAQAKIQKELISIAYKMLKPGGLLVYSTCSFSYEEDEEIVQFLLENEPNATLITVPKFEGEFRSKDLPESVHLLPSLWNGEGMFISFILKNSGDLQGFSPKNRVFSPAKHQSIEELNTFKYEVKAGDYLYLTNNEINLKYFSVLSYGLSAYEIKNNIKIPTFHLAHFLPNSYSIPLTNNEFKLYIHGDTLKLDPTLKDGYYIVSYKGLNLGYTKKVKETFKNLYPKGLRH